MKVRSSWKAALTAVGVLVAGLAGAAPGAVAAAPGVAAPVFWRVPVTADQVTGLARAGFDVAESDREAAYVVGDQTVAQRLRTLGYRPAYFDTVYKDVPAASARAAAADTFYGGHRTVAAQEAHLTQVASAHPDLATVYTLGPSWKKTKGQGGHDLKAICLSKKQAGDCSLSTTSPKPKFVLMAQIHARELSTGELAWRWIDYLADGYASDATAKSILDTTEVWVIPIANPDGVDIVASGGNSPKLQRKNADNTRGGCTGTNVGIDVNRNSTFKWGGDSNSPCAETYQGVSAGSEPETQALEKFFRAIYPAQRGTGTNDPAPVTARGTMITLHSYGNDIVIPWGFTQSTSPNDAQYRKLGAKFTASNGYLVGTNRETVGYDTSGTTDDFTYGALGVASFTFEVGASSGTCGGFLPKYSCVDSTFWPKNKGAFITAAQAAAAPYRQ
ncbi:M14 family zinc carboxypeptidase [Amycolatopsis rhabdoformis]|uniref:M14 family zinc carboxypeptidase n=1 Tax=Amycolatopsis rhabdoformis TaxID=1448059 RepID=A0ABZ1ICI9_9PSEU|nr:M14 family zinc carboxypeptidase [Amycolatopsis rhabdoformis]WSE31746.1 M14 family zinc carboxypeptidase [Amycolatopsis rhabdoformis]